ncbi:MAG: hypothetical protein Q8P49_03895 [Candidatus Liptonbacteria bacterium]|nr:hypothetical protein [Candidatus Liptonbacteria bacterium]
MSRNAKWLFFSLIAVILAFFAGASAVENHVIPSTLVAHPVLTWQMMHRYPIGAEVLIADNADEDMVQHFAGLGWEKNPVFFHTYVVDYTYEAGLENEPRLNLVLDTGISQIPSVHPTWARSLPHVTRPR